MTVTIIKISKQVATAITNGGPASAHYRLYQRKANESRSIVELHGPRGASWTLRPQVSA